MKRRGLLVALATPTAAFAGCLADDDGAPEERNGDAGDPDDGNDDAGLEERNDDETGSVATRLDGEPSRPECQVEAKTVEVEQGGETREYESAETVPYPEPPAAFAREEVVEYVDAFERAYVTHDVLCDRRGSGRVLEVGYSVRERETFDWGDDVTTVVLTRAAGAVSGTDGGGRVWEAELPPEGVVYAVDESGVARAEFDDPPPSDRDGLESRAPDPLEEGDLVAAFG